VSFPAPTVNNRADSTEPRVPSPQEKYGSLPSNAAMTIEVEDWFHDDLLSRAVEPGSWDTLELRVDRAADRMLTQMAHHGAASTCFILGWCAEKKPALVKRIAAAGHEIACHGYGHLPVSVLKPHEFKRDAERAKKLLEDLTGMPVRGYRAPAFSITDWAIDVLQSLGFEYDSSTFARPARIHNANLRGLSDGAPVVQLRKGFHEIGVSCGSFLGRCTPWSGGYLRLSPYLFFRAGVKKTLRAAGPFVFAIRSWETDHGQPRVAGLKRSHAFRHYVNLARGERGFNNLLRDFNWTTLGDLLARSKPDGPPTQSPSAA
jgi:polysaccharide deacetylase family protein (PEP-CTERM system associated)